MRAIRKRYFARSEPGSDDHPFSNAPRAASTARATSSFVALPTVASVSSVDGEIVSYVSEGSSHSPPTYSPYRSRSLTTAVDSGAGAYVQSFGTGARSCLRWISVKGEVVGSLVRAGLLLAELHEDVVQERRRAEPVEVGCEPVGAERLVHEHEVLDRLLRLADAACGLEADAPAGLL